MVTRSKATSSISTPSCLFVITTPSSFAEPTTYQEVFQIPEWTQAMNEEFQALQT